MNKVKVSLEDLAMDMANVSETIGNAVKTTDTQQKTAENIINANVVQPKPKTKKTTEMKKVNEDARSYTYNPIFNLGDERVIRIKRKARGTGAGRNTSIYISTEAEEVLKKLCEEHRMTQSECINTLILNSK